MSEFFVTAICNPSVAKADSFLINHSKAYTLAVLFSWTEFWGRFFFFRISFNLMSNAGLLLATLGQSIRIIAMATCGENFNHTIQQKKKTIMF